ncbi:MAG: type II toxin-antitoxin system PemK/MazF family toxin [Deltaproteobacteria bacterium]|nr:type II toxin-antitoxin system PemK/MazF family toxin [Deltaproteobacteria bacterium]
MKRGEVFWAELAPRSGSEQSGRRPVIVVSHDGFNRVPTWRSVVVVPLSTSAVQARRGPTAIILDTSATGLRRDSVALCHQVTTLDRSKLARRVTALSPLSMRRVGEGLKAALDLW